MTIVIVVLQLCKILTMVFHMSVCFDRSFSLGTGTEPVNDWRYSSIIVNTRPWTSSMT